MLDIQTAQARDLGPEIAAREDAAPGAYPRESIDALFDSRFIAGPFSPANGGLGWNATESTRAIYELATFSPSAALIASMPVGLASAFAVAGDIAPEGAARGTAEQLEWAADEYRAHRLMAACNSEKGAGGSLAATKTVATKATGGFSLTGEKILASGGRNASWFFSTAKAAPEDLPGCGVVELFLVPTDAEGVEVMDDWDGFGMRSTESQTVRYSGAPARSIVGFPNFIEVVQPLSYWYLLFAAIPLGCARAILDAMSDPAPAGPAVRSRLNDALMRIEALEAYLLATASEWRPGAGPAFAARAMRTKSYVAQEATRTAGDLFALSGGRHYRRDSRLARMFADSFAGTALRPPLPLALDLMAEQFGG